MKNKKTIAYVLIGGAAIVVLYFLYTKFVKGSASTLGAGSPDNRGVWAADDDATYTAMRETFIAKSGDAGALGSWVDDAVKKKYDAGGSSIHKIQGQKSKAGTFLSVFEEANPNVKGKFKKGTDAPAGSGTDRALWPESLHGDLWNMFYALKGKYPAL